MKEDSIEVHITKSDDAGNQITFIREFTIHSKLVQIFPNLLVGLVSMCIVLDHVAVTLLVLMEHPMGWFPC